jgi:hypothetical protein
MSKFIFLPTTIPESPDFSDLPWSLPVSAWYQQHPRLEEVQQGISRHPVVFANYSGKLYGIKELPMNIAKKEYELLSQIYAAQLPAVKPIGYASVQRENHQNSILFTQFLEASVPYRSLFISNAVQRYQTHLLDAISGLLVQLH